MSRNRAAILADIEKFNLDPNVHHRETHANGRLAKTPTTPVESVVEPVVNVSVETQPEIVDEPKVIDDEKLVDQDVKSDPEPVEQVSKKKGKKQATE